jgi:hypothetical protein
VIAALVPVQFLPPSWRRSEIARTARGGGCHRTLAARPRAAASGPGCRGAAATTPPGGHHRIGMVSSG